jgi:putative ABC transport system permease protein
MSPLESLRIAMRALRVNKLRSALTVLGIVVGVAAVVCMVSVGAGARAEVSEKIRTLGANLLLVMPGARNSGGARLESGTQPTLTEEDAASIRRELVDAQVAAPLLSRSMSLVAANKSWMTVVAGIKQAKRAFRVSWIDPNTKTDRPVLAILQRRAISVASGE